MPASTPGRSGTWTRSALQRAGIAGTRARACGGGSPTPRRSSARGSRRRPRSSAGSTCSIRRRCSASAARDRVGVVEEDVDPDARVRAGDARHVAQRAAGVRERLVARRRAPRRSGSRRRSRARAARGSSARRAGRARSASIATGVAPSSVDEAVHEPVALRVGLRDRRQEPRRALEEPGARVLGAARLGAADRMAADEARRAAGGRDDARLRRADVGDGRRLAGRRRARPRTCAGSCGDRRGDDDELGAVDAPSSSVAARRRRRLASTAAASASGSGSQPATVVAARAAPRAPTEAPIRPVPDDRRAARRHASARASARPGGTRGRATGARSGAGRRASRSATTSCSSSTSSAPPRHSVTSSPVNSRCTPPGQTPSCPAGGEEALDLAP